MQYPYQPYPDVNASLQAQTGAAPETQAPLMAQWRSEIAHLSDRLGGLVTDLRNFGNEILGTEPEPVGPQAADFGGPMSQSAAINVEISRLNQLMIEAEARMSRLRRIA